VKPATTVQFAMTALVVKVLPLSVPPQLPPTGPDMKPAAGDSVNWTVAPWNTVWTAEGFIDPFAAWIGVTVKVGGGGATGARATPRNAVLAAAVARSVGAGAAGIVPLWPLVSTSITSSPPPLAVLPPLRTREERDRRAVRYTCNPAIPVGAGAGRSVNDPCPPTSENFWMPATWSAT
jgi:hypothetical protein